MAGTGEPRRALASLRTQEVGEEEVVGAPRHRFAVPADLDSRRGRRALADESVDDNGWSDERSDEWTAEEPRIGARAAAWPLDPELTDSRPFTSATSARPRRSARVVEIADEEDLPSLEAPEPVEPEIRPARARRTAEPESESELGSVSVVAPEPDVTVVEPVIVAKPTEPEVVTAEVVEPEQVDSVELESVQVEPELTSVEPEPAEPEPTAWTSPTPEPAVPEPAEPEPTAWTSPTPEPAVPELVEPEPTAWASPTPEPAVPEPAEPEPTAWADLTSEPAAPEPVGWADPTPEPAVPEPVGWADLTPGPAVPEPVGWADPAPEPVIRGPVIPEPSGLFVWPRPTPEPAAPEPVVPEPTIPGPSAVEPAPVVPEPEVAERESVPPAPYVEPAIWERPAPETPAVATSLERTDEPAAEAAVPAVLAEPTPPPVQRPAPPRPQPAEGRSRPARIPRPAPAPGAVLGLGVAPIRFRGLRKTYDSVVAVDGVDLNVPAGRVTALLGPNGAGKTTMLRLLLGLTRPSAGSAMFGRSRYAQLDRPQRRVGAVLEPHFHPSRTGRNHLRVLAATAGESDTRVDEMLALVGLSAVGRRAVGGYSAGMRQRLALAGALLGDPDYLILDEPTKGLDAIGLHWLRDLLESFADSGRAVLMSSCLMSEVSLVADEAVVLEAGRVRRTSSVAELELAAAMVRVRVNEFDTARSVITDLGLPFSEGRDNQGPYLRVRGEHTETIGAALFIAHVAVFELSRESAELTTDVLAAVAVA